MVPMLTLISKNMFLFFRGSQAISSISIILPTPALDGDPGFDVRSLRPGRHPFWGYYY